MSSSIESSSEDVELAKSNLAELYKHLLRLYTGGESSSVSEAEAVQIADSLAYMLGLNKGESAIRSLSCSSHKAYFHFDSKLRELNAKVDAALDTWQQICILMPPIRNVALRDTLTSIGSIKSRYDTYFAAHEVPCDIDYQLSEPVDDREFRGIDYVQAWLDQLLAETQWIAQFTAESCIEALEGCCPDYRGLHVNLYDLLKPREGQLRRNEG